MSNPAWAMWAGFLHVFVGELWIDDGMAVLGLEGRLDAAWDRLPAVQKKDCHGANLSSMA
jgi:hypothetical protein